MMFVVVLVVISSTLDVIRNRSPKMHKINTLDLLTDFIISEIIMIFIVVVEVRISSIVAVIRNRRPENTHAELNLY